MIKAKIIPAMALFFVMLASCGLIPDFSLKEPDDFDTLEEGSFYARYMTADFRNMPNNGFYKVKAEMLYEGEKCEIWAEIDSRVRVTKARAKEVADEYDAVIRPIIVETFGSKFADDSDILDYANRLAGRNNGKLTILLLDIQDEFNPQTYSYSYVAGYFYPGNFYQPTGKINDNNYSNGRDMIYVDTYPGLTRLTQAYATFAHELQHLVNFVTSRGLGKGYTDTWVDEGLSSYAEYLYLGKNPEDTCEWFSEDPNGTIAEGNNFFVWGNHSENPSTIHDDYATVYLFFRWLYLQAVDKGLQSGIFREIMRSDDSDFNAVTSVAAWIDPAWGNWETLLRTWLAANHDPKNAVYGYKGDRYLQEGEGRSPNRNYKGIRVNSIGRTEIPLYPGEGVYINGSVSPVAGTGVNIRYVELAGNTGVTNVLLTFNANSNNSARPETGYLTGVSPSPAASRTAAENSWPGRWARPYVIDAQDILGRNRDKSIHLPR